MKKFVFIILALVVVMHLVGCGKKEQSLTEMQEPISIEELSKLDSSIQTVPEVVTKTAPAVTVTPSSAVPPAETKAAEIQLGQLPPSGPYKPTVREIQTALKNAGFYPGMIDGKKGPMTKKAIEDFQKANNLGVDGKVGSKTWAVLSPYLNPAPVPSKPGKKKR
jgi:peptidoglycan hydrolase-like protein with peptidoglycan-binding domain